MIMETRPAIMTLIDYEVFFGTKVPESNASALIAGIPSKTLINYISGLAVNCYLNDNIDSGYVQARLIDIFISKTSIAFQKNWKTFLNRFAADHHVPVVIWAYGNLLFYDLIFTHWNDQPMRDIIADEAERIFKAYLVLNGISNSHIDPEKLEAHKHEKDFYEDYVVPEFLPQRDYASTSDYTNQITRGAMLFEWLETNPKFSDAVLEYYETKLVSGWRMMFKNIMTIFSEINVTEKNKQRNQLVDLNEFSKKELAIGYLKTLAINSSVSSYQKDLSFGKIRQQMLYALDDVSYFVLDINFLIDQFYKAQVFALSAYFAKTGVDREFLSTKGKDFMEEIYLKKLMNKCFAGMIKHYGDSALNSAKEEMTDFYLRQGHQVCLTEFKDVILNAAAKNSSDKTQLYDAVDIKFKKNQKGKAKGIGQLINAITDIHKYGVAFDSIVTDKKLELFPVILYTDHTFGVDSLNRRYDREFREEISKLNLQQLVVKPLVFINLNTFELHESNFADKQVNLFSLMEAYYKHIARENYANTPFEVFFRFYLNENNIPLSTKRPEFSRVVNEVINQFD
jgi:hypothetical protein